MKPCTYCQCVDEHNQHCPHKQPNKLIQWNQGYNDGKQGLPKQNTCPTYELGWSMSIHLGKASLLNHPGC